MMESQAFRHLLKGYQGARTERAGNQDSVLAYRHEIRWEAPGAPRSRLFDSQGLHKP